MDPKRVNIWYDPKGDFLEVMWAQAAGAFVDTVDGHADVKIDDDGNLLGFHIFGVSKITQPLCVTFDTDNPDVEQCQCRKAPTQPSDT